MSLLVNAVYAAVIGLLWILAFTCIVVLTNKTIRYSRAQVRYIRVWRLIRVAAGLVICGTVGAVVMQAFDLWLT